MHLGAQLESEYLEKIHGELSASACCIVDTGPEDEDEAISPFSQEIRPVSLNGHQQCAFSCGICDIRRHCGHAVHSDAGRVLCLLLHLPFPASLLFLLCPWRALALSVRPTHHLLTELP